jgi:hypothetical protein
VQTEQEERFVTAELTFVSVLMFGIHLSHSATVSFAKRSFPRQMVPLSVFASMRRILFHEKYDLKLWTLKHSCSKQPIASDAASPLLLPPPTSTT